MFENFGGFLKKKTKEAAIGLASLGAVGGAQAETHIPENIDSIEKKEIQAASREDKIDGDIAPLNLEAVKMSLDKAKENLPRRERELENAKDTLLSWQGEFHKVLNQFKNEPGAKKDIKGFDDMLSDIHKAVLSLSNAKKEAGEFENVDFLKNFGTVLEQHVQGEDSLSANSVTAFSVFLSKKDTNFEENSSLVRHITNAEWGVIVAEFLLERTQNKIKDLESILATSSEDKSKEESDVASLEQK